MATDVWRVEARNILNIPRYTGQPPTLKNDRVPSASGAAAEKACCRALVRITALSPSLNISRVTSC